VSADAPASLYWSATAYELAAHALIRDMPPASRSSRNARPNGGGSVDVYFGPNASSGKESNWAPTNANGQFDRAPRGACQ
jgi:hypothetical protein